MGELTMTRISLLGIALLVASVGAALITKDKNDVLKNGHLTQNGFETSDDATCRKPINDDVKNCNDTRGNSANTSSTNPDELTNDDATSDGLAANTSGFD